MTRVECAKEIIDSLARITGTAACTGQTIALRDQDAGNLSPELAARWKKAQKKMARLMDDTFDELNDQV